jgi:hypothetical protein
MQDHWFFAFQQPLSAQQAEQLRAALNAALPQWQAHGSPVDSEYELRHGQFLLVRALSDPSGCAIDWMQKTVSNISEQLSLPLAGNEQIFFHDGEHFTSRDFRQIKDAVRNGELGPDTLLLDTTVIRQSTFEGLEKRLADSWLGRYLPSPTPER